MAIRSKESWRRRFRTYRRSLSPGAYRARSTLVAHRCLAVSDVARADAVHAYWPLTDQREVDTRPLIAGLRGRGARIVLPVVTSFEPDTPSLEHRQYRGPKSLHTNRWCIREPWHTDRVSLDTVDVVLVPALGIGENGHRLGHGSGYYDAFLQSLTCPRIGLTYEACLVSSVPHASHDVPLTHIVTERRTLTL
jgi:5-formyltetrahydrofolate cyclo-ligase